MKRLDVLLDLSTFLSFYNLKFLIIRSDPDFYTTGSGSVTLAWVGGYRKDHAIEEG